MCKQLMILVALLSGCMFFSCSESDNYSDNPDMPHFVYLYSQTETNVSIGEVLDAGETETSLQVMLRYGVADDKTATVEAVVEADFSLVEAYNRINAKEYLPFPAANLSGLSASASISSGSVETSVPFKLIDLDKMSDAQYLLPITIKSATASNGFPIHDKKKTVYYLVSQQGAKTFKLSAAEPCVIQAIDFDLGGEGVAYHDNDPANHGGSKYRESLGDKDCGVDIQTDNVICYTAAGEWLVYTVRVLDEGDYAVDLDIAVGWGGKFSFEIDGRTDTDVFELAVAGNWNCAWYYETHPEDAPPVLNLKKGTHKIKFKEASDGFNLRNLRFTYRN